MNTKKGQVPWWIIALVISLITAIVVVVMIVKYDPSKIDLPFP